MYSVCPAFVKHFPKYRIFKSTVILTRRSVCVLRCSLVFSYRLDSRLIKMSRLILKTTVSCTFYHFRAKITNLGLWETAWKTCKGLLWFFQHPALVIKWEGIWWGRVLSSIVIHYSRLSLPLAWKTLSNGILTIRDMSQLLDWTNYQLTWSWSTWSTHGELLLNCGTAIWTRGMLLQHKTAAMCFVLHFFSFLFKVPRLYVAFSLNLNFPPVVFEVPF